MEGKENSRGTRDARSAAPRPACRGGGSAPVILSASRSTDVPAFYAEWFMNRLRAGRLVWTNPFNRRPMVVDLTHVAGIVFWSKNPRPLLPYLDEIADRGIDFYFQYTLNDYAAEGFEPRVPPLAERLATFRALSEKLGPERVVWRFDPICLSERLRVADVLERLERLAGEIGSYSRRLVVSFVDVAAYAKVRRHVRSEARDGTSDVLREPAPEEQDVLAAGIADIAKRHGLAPSACGESRSFARFGVPPARCIDGELFAAICSPRNFALRRHLGLDASGQGSLLAASSPRAPRVRKDPGQRAACGCMASKDIGMYDTCGHLCVYCYANASPRRVARNMALHDPTAESIVPG